MRLQSLRWCHSDDRGTVLLVVLVVFLTIAMLSSSFIWLMTQQQTRAGVRYRSAAAMALAEAGVHRALSILETVTPDGKSAGRTWRPASYSEMAQVGSFEGQFTLSLADSADGGVEVVSVGQAGGISRRLRATVYLASPALLAALYGASIVRLEDSPTAVFIVPYGVIGNHPWFHIASGRGIWFASPDAPINDPSLSFQVGLGPVDVPSDYRDSSVSARPAPMRVLLPRDGTLRLDRQSKAVNVDQLRTLGVNIEGVVLPTEEMPVLPQVDVVFYQEQAAGNFSNADLNEAAGKYTGDSNLARKRDSFYSHHEFEELQAYLNAGIRRAWLQGTIYVKGAVHLREGQQLQIREGALIADGTVELAQGALLSVVHSAASRTLPGIVTLSKGDVIVGPGAKLRVHGLVYAARTVDVLAGASVDIVGGVLAAGPGFSFNVSGGTVVIRYDPAVSGTPGLLVPGAAAAIAWVARWEELP